MSCSLVMKSFISPRRFVVPFEPALEGLLATRGPRARHPATTMSRDDDNASKIAEKLLEGVERLSPDHVATDCPLSALRIQEGTGRRAVHPIVLIRDAYGLGER